MRHFQSYLIMKDKQQIVIHPELTWDDILEYRLEGCRLHTSAALKLQLFASDLPLNQSEYTADSISDTLSFNQNRVDRRKWNFSVIFTLTHL